MFCISSSTFNPNSNLSQSMCALYYGLSSWMVPDKTIERRKEKEQVQIKRFAYLDSCFLFFSWIGEWLPKKKILFCFFSFQMTGRNCTLFADCLKIEFQKEKKKKSENLGPGWKAPHSALLRGVRDWADESVTRSFFFWNSSSSQRLWRCVCVTIVKKR